MPKNFISVDQTKARGVALVQLTANLAALRDHCLQIKLNMDQMTDQVDYSIIEAQFGLPTGTGSEVYATVVALNTALQGSVVLNMTSYLGIVY